MKAQVDSGLAFCRGSLSTTQIHAPLCQSLCNKTLIGQRQFTALKLDVRTLTSFKRLIRFRIFERVLYSRIDILMSYRYHPVGQISVSWNLHCSEAGDVEMASEILSSNIKQKISNSPWIRWSDFRFWEKFSFLFNLKCQNWMLRNVIK